MKSVSRVHQQKQRNDSYREALEVFPILSNNDVDAISLRVLEFLTEPAFVEECKRANIPLSYYVESSDGTQRRLFNLPAELWAHQNARRKKFMEPFARQNRDLENGGRFEFGHGDSKVETNVAQLQFCRFLVENNVLDWVRRHRDMVFTAKSRCEAQRAQKKRGGGDRSPVQKRKRASIDTRAL